VPDLSYEATVALTGVTDNTKKLARAQWDTMVAALKQVGPTLFLKHAAAQQGGRRRGARRGRACFRDTGQDWKNLCGACYRSANKRVCNF
jgi:hypothetical protein